MNSEQMQSMQTMEMKIDASNIAYPTAPNVGDKLDDAKVTIQASTSGVQTINMTTTITDRTIDATEELTTPAGSYSCMVISQSSNVTFSFVNKTFKSKDWYVAGFGVVRSESYKENGKLVSYTLLTKYEG